MKIQFRVACVGWLLGSLAVDVPLGTLRADPSADPVMLRAASKRAGGDGVALRWTIKTDWLPAGGFNVYRRGESKPLNPKPLGANVGANVDPGRETAKEAGARWKVSEKTELLSSDYETALHDASHPPVGVDEKSVRAFSANRHARPDSAQPIFEAIGKAVEDLRNAPGPSMPAKLAEVQIRNNPIVAPYMAKLLKTAPPPKSPGGPVQLAPQNRVAGHAPFAGAKPVDPVKATLMLRQNLLAGALIHPAMANDLGLACDDESARAGGTYKYELRSIDSAGREKVVAYVELSNVGADAPAAPSELIAHQLDEDSVALRWKRPTQKEMDTLGMASYQVYRLGDANSDKPRNQSPIVIADIPVDGGHLEQINFFKDQRVNVGSWGYQLVQIDMFGRETKSEILPFTMKDWHMPAASSAAQAELNGEDVTVAWCKSALKGGGTEADVQYRVYREDVEKDAGENAGIAENANKVAQGNVLSDSLSHLNNTKAQSLMTQSATAEKRNSIGANWELLTPTGVKGDKFNLAFAQKNGRLAHAVPKSARPDDWMHYIDHNVPKDHKYRYFVTAFYPINKFETTGTGTTQVPIPTTVAPQPAHLTATIKPISKPDGMKSTESEGDSSVKKAPNGSYFIPAKNDHAQITLPANFKKDATQDIGATVTLAWDAVPGIAPVSYRVYRGSATRLSTTATAKDPSQQSSPGPATPSASPKVVTSQSTKIATASASANRAFFFQMPPAALEGMQIGNNSLHFEEELQTIPDDSFALLGEVTHPTFVDEIPRSQAHHYIYRVIAVNRWGVPAGGPKEGVRGIEKKVRVPATLPPSAPAVFSVAQRDEATIELQFHPNLKEENVTRYDIKRGVMPPGPAKSMSVAAPGAAMKGAARFGIHPAESAMQTYVRANPKVRTEGLPIGPSDLAYEVIGTVNPTAVKDGVLTFPDTVVEADRVYAYYVVAVNECGRSRSGNHLCAKTILSSEYAGPASLTSAVSCESVKLVWPVTKDAAKGYIVERAPQETPSNRVQLTGIIPATSYTDYSILPGQSYTYNVVGVTEYGDVTKPVLTTVTVPTK